MGLVKVAKEWGNGAGVRVPRKWLGMEVEIEPMIPLTMDEIRNYVIKELNPYLHEIQGAYLAGSYARGEQTSTSDVDVLVIADKPINIPKKEPYDFYVISENKIQKIIKYYPLQIMSMSKEAKPIINSGLLENLNKIKLKPSYFKEYLESTKRSLEIIKELMHGYKDNDVATDSLIYPIILRLRGVYLVESLLKNKKYQTTKIKEDIERLGINKERIGEIYRIYQIKRDSKRGIKSTITIGEIKKIYGLALNKYNEVIKWLKEK